MIQNANQLVHSTSSTEENIQNESERNKISDGPKPVPSGLTILKKGDF